MGTQRLLAGFGIIEETGTQQRLLAGFGVLDESASVSTTISCTVGDAAAGGPNATVTQDGSTTILCSVGNAAAGGPSALIGQGLTIVGTPGNAAAGGPTAAVQTYLVLDYAINNTETGRIASQAVSYTWWPAGRIGSIVGITPVDYTGTIGSDGRLVTAILKAAGIVMMTKRVTSALDDEVFYQAFP